MKNKQLANEANCIGQIVTSLMERIEELEFQCDAKDDNLDLLENKIKELEKEIRFTDRSNMSNEDFDKREFSV